MTTPDKETENLLTTKEFSERSGKPMATVQKWLRTGKLNGTKIGNRWYIAPSELSRPAADGGASAPTARQDTTAPQKAVPEVGNTQAARRYTVTEFSALTYLTETGVRRWLQSGRLIGERASDGSWTVNGESLDLPHLRHLIR
jgi:hypothetical protein